VANFVNVKSKNSTSKVAQVFIREIVRLHGVPKKIISDAKFTLKFWRELFVSLEIELTFSTTYHPQTNGKIDRANKILEDMLRMYVMHQPKKWEEYLQLVDFGYNKRYKELLRMIPFEVLYRKSCNTPISWSDTMNKVLISPNMCWNYGTCVVLDGNPHTG